MNFRVYIGTLFVALLSVSPGFSQSHLDFESVPVGAYTASNAISGWTLESVPGSFTNSCTSGTIAWTGGAPSLSIIATPVGNHPDIGYIPHSPFGGAKVLQIKNLNNQSPLRTRFTTSINVTNPSQVLEIARAFAIEGWAHNCCEQATIRIELFDCNNNPIPCHSLQVDRVGGGCGIAASTFSTSINGASYTNWEIRRFSMRQYAGSCLRLQITVADCSYGGHGADFFFDARVSFDPYLNGVLYCPGSNSVIIAGPPTAYNYSWIAPANAPALANPTASFVSISNPTPGLTYTLLTNQWWFCPETTVYTLTPATFTIPDLVTASSCSTGASGSASIPLPGPASLYTYTWTGSSGVIGNGPIVTGLAPGVYTVNVGFSNCTDTKTFTIGSGAIPYSELPVYYCGTEAYLDAPSGASYQWYINSSPVSSASGGTSPSFTASPVVNNGIYSLAFNGGQGCRDSLRYLLVLHNPGINASATSTCSGLPGSTLTLSRPAPWAYSAFFYTLTAVQPGGSVITGSATPVWPTNNFVVPGLVAGATYSVQIFDGTCRNSRTLTIPSTPINYVLNPTSATVCAGQNFQAQVTVFSGSPISYSWSVAHPAGSFTNNILVLSNIVGGAQQINYPYSVTFTNHATTCTYNATGTVAVEQPVMPLIGSVPAVCQDQVIAASAWPPGGTYSGHTNALGVVNTSSPGTFTVGYTYGPPACPQMTITSVTVHPRPSVSITGTNSLCQGDSALLQASGANTYSWNTGSTANSIYFSPFSSSSAVLYGTSIHGCTNTALHTVNVKPAPVFAVSGNSACAGRNGVLTVYGAPLNTYTWSTGSTSVSLPYNHTGSVTYTLNVKNVYNCAASKVVSVHIAPEPTVQLQGLRPVCAGDALPLTASGAYSYTWSNGSSGNSVIIVPDSSAQYHVAGINLPGVCTQTLAFYVTVHACTGLADEQDEDSVLIYPNPASGKLYFSAGVEGRFTLFNVLGDQVLDTMLDEGLNHLDTSLLPDGSYTFVFITTTIQYHGKLLISR